MRTSVLLPVVVWETWGYKTNGYYTVYDPATGTGDLVLNANGTWSLREGLKDNSYTYFGGLYPGVLKVQVDENGDPIKQRLGNTVAPTTGGFGFDGRIGNFDFNVFFNYSLGNKLVNGTKLANSFYAVQARTTTWLQTLILRTVIHGSTLRQS